MNRLSAETKNRILHLSKNGFSLNKISGVLHLSKTTIYYHTRKQKGKRFFRIKINESDDEKIGEFIGIFTGDGYYFLDRKYEHRIKIFFSKNEAKVAKYYSSVFKFLFNKKPRIYKIKNIIILEIISKDVINFIRKFLIWKGKKSRTVHLVNNNLSEKLMIGFLRGLIDSDGYVRKERKEIYFGTVSKNLLNNFIESLKRFDFKFKIYQQRKSRGAKIFYKVRLTNNEVTRFCKLIKPIKSYGLTGI